MRVAAGRKRPADFTTTRGDGRQLTVWTLAGERDSQTPAPAGLIRFAVGAALLRLVWSAAS